MRDPVAQHGNGLGTLIGQIIFLALIGIDFRVVLNRQERVPQTEVGREVDNRVAGFHVDRALADGPVGGNLALRLQLLDEIIDLGQIPLVHLAVPGTVEPQFGHRSVLGHQFAELLFHEFDIFARVRIPIKRFVAVPQRVVDGKGDAFLLAGVGHGPHDIGLMAHLRVGHIIIGVFAVPQAETVVVLGGEHDGAHAGTFGMAHPLGRLLGNISRGSIDRSRSRTVAPLGIQISVHTKMKEHAVFTVDHGLLSRSGNHVGPGRTGCTGGEQQRQGQQERIIFHV